MPRRQAEPRRRAPRLGLAATVPRPVTVLVQAGPSGPAAFRAPRAVVTTTLQDAMAVARGDALRRSSAEIAVIGGAEIYAQTLHLADCIELTLVHAKPLGDAHFAALDRDVWEEIAHERHAAGAADSVDFSYVTYRRAAAD